MPRGHLLLVSLALIPAVAACVYENAPVAAPGAIMRHGGEAQTARDAFAALGLRERLFLRAFLNSL